MSVPFAAALLLCVSATEQVTVIKGDAVAHGTEAYMVPAHCGDLNGAKTLLADAHADVAKDTPKPQPQKAKAKPKKKKKKVRRRRRRK